ncbi:MAG: hypothetical protein WC526_02480 [Patescibacteria group bacterium]
MMFARKFVLVIAATIVVATLSAPAHAQWFKDREARKGAREAKSLYEAQRERIQKLEAQRENINKLEAEVAQCLAEAKKPKPAPAPPTPVSCDQSDLYKKLNKLKKFQKDQLDSLQDQMTKLARGSKKEIGELRQLLESISRVLPNIRSIESAITQLKMDMSITSNNVNEILNEMAGALTNLKKTDKRLEKVESDLSGLHKRVEKVEKVLLTKQDKLFVDISVGSRVSWFKGDSVEPYVELRLDFEVPSDGLCSFVPGFSLAFATSKDKAPANAVRLMGKCGRRTFRFLFGVEELMVAKTETGPGQFTWYVNPIIGIAIGGRWAEFTLLGSPSIRFREANAAFGVQGFAGLVIRF